MQKATTALILILGLILILNKGSASERPTWVQKGSHADDSVYRYYIGRSAASTESEAAADARSDAQVQLVRENFGTETQIELRALENSKSSKTLKSIDEVFPKIRFEGFEQQDAYFETTPSGVEAWILFRFPKTAIAREKLRLAKGIGLSDTPEWSEQGSASLARSKGTLEVVSEPAGAEVFIDGKRFGLTPARLKGVLDLGAHELVIEHPEKARYEERIQLVADRTTRVDKKLRRALGALSITTTPSGARVRLEGHPAGLSPVQNFPVSAGKRISIEIRHDKALPVSTEIIVRKDRHESRHFRLETAAKNSDDQPEESN